MGENLRSRRELARPEKERRENGRLLRKAESRGRAPAVRRGHQVPRGYEIRKYHAAIAAEVHVENGNQMKGSEGFRALAKYIGAFGTPDNKKKEAIKMTAPVVTQPLKDDVTEAAGEKIAMTAPVVTGARNEDSGGSGYWMQFIMPSKWTMETLPEPTNPSVRLTAIPERYLF